MQPRRPKGIHATSTSTASRGEGSMGEPSSGDSINRRRLRTASTMSMSVARNTPPATGNNVEGQRDMAALNEDDKSATCTSFLTIIVASEATLAIHWLKYSLCAVQVAWPLQHLAPIQSLPPHWPYSFAHCVPATVAVACTTGRGAGVRDGMGASVGAGIGAGMRAARGCEEAGARPLLGMLEHVLLPSGGVHCM